MSAADIALLLAVAYVAFLIRRGLMGGEVGLFSSLFFLLVLIVVGNVLIYGAQLMGWRPPWN